MRYRTILTLRLTHKAILVLILIALAVRVPLLCVRYFDADEFEHLHAARCVNHGMVPYRDFFEHHTPLMFFLLAPLYRFWPDSIPLLFVARVLMLLFTCGIIYVTYRMAKMLYGIDVAFYAILFLSYTIMFLEKTIEVRPDVPAVLFWLLSLGSFIKAVRRGEGPPPAPGTAHTQRKYFTACGVMIAIAILFTQKAFFAGAGLFLASGWFLLDRRCGGTMRGRATAFLWIGLGALVPMSAVSAYFLFNNAFRDFIYWDFIMNARWQHRLPYAHLWPIRSFLQNSLFYMFGAAGVIGAVSRLRGTEEISRGGFAPLIALYMLVVGLVLIPSPHRQYYLLLFPLVAIYSGHALDICVRECAARGTSRQRCILVAALVSAGIVFFPLELMRTQFARRNTAQLEQIRFILRNTTERDTVFDGWTGMGVFRDHAYYYWFLNADVIVILTTKVTQDDVVNVLRARRPKIVIYDGFLRLLPPYVTQYIESNYKPTGVGNLYILSGSTTGYS